jgi:H/ACA ribonucleoprotein complex non-core subunit NAF1
MDAQDFTMPSPKRQRTESPTPALESKHQEIIQSQPPPAEQSTSEEVDMKPSESADKESSTIPDLDSLADSKVEPSTVEAQASVPQSNGFLDALMQHVESTSQPQPENNASAAAQETTKPTYTQVADTSGSTEGPSIKTADTQPGQNIVTPGLTLAAAEKQPIHEAELITESREEAGTKAVSDGVATQDQTMSDAQPPNAEPAGAEGAEWEVDSSPYESSDSDDSSDTTSDESDDADGDYAMLDPEEQARILMAGDGGSDDEGDKKGKTEGGHLRTANEKIEEVIPKPDIVVTEEMKIEELGTVEGIVEKTVLVRAKVSGEYQVLESNSLLCLGDRSVVGVVAEPLGRVEQPMYTIRFTNDEAIKEAGLSERGTKVFYVPQHSTFVFTRPLKAVKGSDASNFHDEEVGDDEMEFSDDEQEAEHKRQMKMKKQGRRDEQGGGRGRGRSGRGNYQRGGRQDYRAPSVDGGSVLGSGQSEISYDDAPAGADEGYTPLARPANLNELMAGVQREPMEGSHYASGYPDRGNADAGRGRGRGRGRGDRDRRGGRGRGGGGNQPSWTTYQNPSTNHSNGYAQQSPQSMPPPTQFPYQYQQQQPHQPRLSPQTQAFSPSPISPLAPSQFGFNFQQHAQQWPGNQSYQQQYVQMPQLHSQYGTHQFAPGQQPDQSNANGWNTNQAGAAHVAAQLEQLRRSQQGQ